MQRIRLGGKPKEAMTAAVPGKAAALACRPRAQAEEHAPPLPLSPPPPLPVDTPAGTHAR